MKKKNFRIVENPTPDYEDKFDEFLKLYNAGKHKVENIKVILDWEQSTYNRAYKHAKSEGLLNKSNLPFEMPEKQKNEPKYYCKQKNRYVISKMINNKRHYFGFYSTEVEARLAVSYFKECGWDKSKTWEIKYKVSKDIESIKNGGGC